MGHLRQACHTAIGHVIFSPPTGQYTRDIAVITVDASKIDLASFGGNVVDLGFKYSPQKLSKMMNPDPKNANEFEYPGDRLLRLHGTIREEDNPDTYDDNGELGIMVMKLGRATDLTVGRANNMFSSCSPALVITARTNLCVPWSGRSCPSMRSSARFLL
jgi:hypothetical protein